MRKRDVDRLKERITHTQTDRQTENTATWKRATVTMRERVRDLQIVHDATLFPLASRR